MYATTCRDEFILWYEYILYSICCLFTSLLGKDEFVLSYDYILYRPTICCLFTSLSGKDLEGSGRGLVLRCYTRIRLEGLRKRTRNPTHDCRSLGERFEPDTSQIRSSLTIRHSTETFCNICFQKYAH
jgi:hypothetical protein